MILRYFHCSAIQGNYHAISPDVLLVQHNDRLFTSASGNELDLIDTVEFRTMRARDDRSEEIPIYNERGDRVRRHRYVPTPGAKEAAVFMALNNLHPLFQDAGSTYFNPNDCEREDRINRYPHSSLHDTGSFQTRQPFPPLTPAINAINHLIALPVEDGDPGDADLYVDTGSDSGEGVRTQQPQQALFGTACQGYNLSTHAFSPNATKHKAMHGEPTAATSGRLAGPQGYKVQAAKAEAKVEHRTPAEAFEEMGGDDGFNASFRLEGVFSLKFNRLQERDRNGAYVYLLITYACCKH